MAWVPSKPAGPDSANTIDDSVIENNQALDTWGSAITSGISAGAAAVLAFVRAAATVIFKGRVTGDSFDRITINNDGQVACGDGTVTPARKWSGPRMVRVKKSASQSTDETEVSVTWDQEDFDTDTMHDNVTSNERLIAPVAGKYQATLNVVATGTSGTNAVFRLKNSAGTLQAQSATSGLLVGLSLSVPVSLAAAGYVYATFRSISAGQSVTIESAILANFSLIYVGE